MAYDPDQRRRALKRFMAERKIKLKPWCERAEVSRGSVQNFFAKRSRTLTDETYHQLAEAAGVPPEVLRGQKPIPSTVPVIAYVGAGAEVFAVDDHMKGAGIGEIPAPPELNGAAVAVVVRGDSMYPAYRDGDVLVYQRREPDDWRRHVGKEVIVQLKDGHSYVKMLKTGGPRTATLGSHNAPDIEGVSVDWASPVLWIKRGA